MEPDVPRLKDLIRDIPDFPKAGVVFKDITPLLADPEGFSLVVENIASKFEGQGIRKVVGIEARGFILAAPIAYRLGAGFVPVRKAGKLPWAVAREEYDRGLTSMARSLLERNYADTDHIQLHYSQNA